MIEKPVKKGILIVEKYPMESNNLADILTKSGAWEVIGQVSLLANVLEFVFEHNPDLVLLGISTPLYESVRICKKIKNQSSLTKILVYTEKEADKVIYRYLKAGVDGYLMRGATGPYELGFAIQSLFEGKSYLSGTILRNIINGYINGKSYQVRM